MVITENTYFRVRKTVPIIHWFFSHTNTILLIKKSTISAVQDHVTDITEIKKIEQQALYSPADALFSKMKKLINTKN